MALSVPFFAGGSQGVAYGITAHREIMSLDV
jgi:hypothetical protein